MSRSDSENNYERTYIWTFRGKMGKNVKYFGVPTKVTRKSFALVFEASWAESSESNIHSKSMDCDILEETLGISRVNYLGSCVGVQRMGSKFI